jgi:uncharacterized membrane protein
MSHATLEEVETARMEAFSDGVFAFAITLLALGLKDPVLSASGSIPLVTGLLNEWPAFFAFITSFVTVLIAWVNHHNMFNYIHRIDPRLMFLNGLLLMFVVLTPFTTSLLSDHILLPDAGTAALVYSGSFFVLALVWNGLWRYASNGLRLLGGHVTREDAESISRQYLAGPLLYGVALASAFVNGLASVAIIFGVAAYFAITATTSRASRRT